MEHSNFSVTFRFPHETVRLFRNFLAVLPELENAPDMQKCPKTFVHDCSLDR